MLILLAVYVLSTLVDVNAFQRSFGLKLSKTAITSSSLQASIIGPNEVVCSNIIIHTN